MRRYHLHITASLVVAVLALVVALATAVPAAIDHARSSARHDAIAQVRDDATDAVVTAQSIPNPSCNPRPGTGRMGACAPVQAMAVANVLAKKLGDPDDVRSFGPIGVDVSNNNGCGYSLRAHGAKFVWFKAGEGLGFTDHCAAGFVTQARALHIPYGGYEFVRPRPDVSPRSEAAAFAHRLYLAHALKAQLAPTADVEVNDRGMSASALNTWACGFVKAARQYLHHRVDVYTGYWFWHGGNCGSDLWEAAYAPNPVVPAGWARKGWRSDVTTWQHSDGSFGPTPRLGADTDVMLHPERYGLRVVRGRLAAKPVQSAAARAKARKLAIWKAHHAIAHRRLRACGPHRAHPSDSVYCRHWRADNRKLHALIRRAGGTP
jgi:hypothetical protein